MTKQFLLSCLLLFTSSLMADQKFNPYSGEWESVPSNWVLMYNNMERNWCYCHPCSCCQLNVFTSKWEMAPCGWAPTYNGVKFRWEWAPIGSILKFNHYENEWSYQPPFAKLVFNSQENKWVWDSAHNC